MWYVCKIAFRNGISSGIESRTYDGLRQGMQDVIRQWGNDEVIGIDMKQIHPNRIKQGRFGEYVRDYYGEGVREWMK